MYFDAQTLAAVVAELQPTIVGGRIQRILQPDTLSIGLEIYSHRQRHALLLSAHPRLARVHLVTDKLSRGVEHASPLLLLLRKYLVGGRIIRIEHPYLERVLILSIVKERETCNYDAPQDATIEQRCDLVVEVMEQRSNILLVDDNNLILDCIKRIPPHKSQRPLLPRHVYELPPRQNKRDPAQATPGGMVEIYQQQGAPMVRALVRGYAGVSPLLAREVVHRATETAGPTAAAVLAQPPAEGQPAHLPLALAEALASHLRSLLDAPGPPVLVVDEAGPTAFAAYPLTHLGGGTPQPTINAALEAFYTPQQNLTRHQQRRAEIQQQLGASRERLEHQRRQLEQAQQQASDLERKRWEGEMIFAFLHTLTPGQTGLEVEGHTIALDPACTPVECAQQRFRAYEKAKSGTETIAQRLRETEARLAGLDEVATLLEIANERDQIEQIAREAEAYGYLPPAPQHGDKKQRKQPARRLRPLHLTSSDGYAIYVGRSAEQNREVTFRIGRPDDLWLHVRQIPGAHVIIRSGGADVPERTLHEAAGLAAYFSRARSESAVDVELSLRKQVRPVSGGPPGLVTYRAMRTVRVPPLPPWE
jgi:predicted ribosome quality control (RQC) complex YloA/Tae2 family protein